MKEEKLITCRFCFAKIPDRAGKCCHCGEWLSKKHRLTSNLVLPIATGLLASLIVGSLLFWFGRLTEVKEQMIRVSVEKERQNDKIIKLLKVEFIDNFAILNNTKKLLEEDLMLLKKNKFIALPLCPFTYDAWERSQFGSADFLVDADTDDFMKLSSLYFILRIIDAQVRNRENYRLQYEGKSGFAERMAILDARILKSIQRVIPVMEQAQKYLDKIHKWKTKGKSFYLDEDIVTDILN
jgi:hypothetical protein